MTREKTTLVAFRCPNPLLVEVRKHLENVNMVCPKGPRLSLTHFMLGAVKVRLGHLRRDREYRARSRKRKKLGVPVPGNPPHPPLSLEEEGA